MEPKTFDSSSAGRCFPADFSSFTCSGRPNRSPMASAAPMMPARMADSPGSKPALRPSLYSASADCANRAGKAGPPVAAMAMLGTDTKMLLKMSAASLSLPLRLRPAFFPVAPARFEVSSANCETPSAPTKSAAPRTAPMPVCASVVAPLTTPLRPELPASLTAKPIRAPIPGSLASGAPACVMYRSCA